MPNHFNFGKCCWALQTGRPDAFPNLCAALLEGNVRFGYRDVLSIGTQLNPTSSLLSAIEVSWKQTLFLQEHAFLKGRLLRSKFCVCQKQCTCSHTYGSLKMIERNAIFPKDIHGMHSFFTLCMLHSLRNRASVKECSIFCKR